jgi:hypothetical protein
LFVRSHFDCVIGVVWVDRSDNELGFRIYVTPVATVQWTCYGGAGCSVNSYTCSSDRRTAADVPANTESATIRLMWSDLARTDYEPAACLMVVSYNTAGESNAITEAWYAKQ